MAIARGELTGFEVESPQESWIGEKVKALDYIRYSPLNLLFYLRGEGRVAVFVDGVPYYLDSASRQHLMEVLEETIRQWESKGYNK